MPFGRTIFIAMLGTGYVIGLQKFSALAERQMEHVKSIYDVESLSASIGAGCDGYCRQD